MDLIVENESLSSQDSAPRGRGPEADRADWFKAEVHPHGGVLKAYLRNTFPGVRDVDDVVQESFLRVWKARTGKPIASAKAFLFRVARNVCLDVLQRDGRSPIQSHVEVESLAVAESDAATEARVAEEKIGILTEAVAALPPRCREIFLLCKFQGCSHAEAAEKLGLSIKTVDEHVSKGYWRLEAELRKRGMGGPNR